MCWPFVAPQRCWNSRPVGTGNCILSPSHSSSTKTRKWWKVKTIKGGAFTGTGTAASYTVPTVRQSAYRVRSPAFHRETLFLRSLCSIKKPAEGAETGNKRVLSVSVSLSLSLQQDSLLAAISNSKKPARSFENYEQQFVSCIISAVFAISFEEKKNKRREKKIRPSCVVGEAFDSYVRMLFFDCFITRLRNCLCSTEAEFPNLVIIFFIDSTFNLTHLLIFLLLFYF